MGRLAGPRSVDRARVSARYDDVLLAIPDSPGRHLPRPDPSFPGASCKMLTVVRLNHVNLGMPVGGAEAEEAFLLEVLGYRRVGTPPEVTALAARLGRQARWFEGEDGKQIHLSEDPDHRPAALAHVAIDVGEDLPALETKLQQAGVEHTASEREVRVVFCQDPAGNRWELRGPIPT